MEKFITYFGQQAKVGCDENCNKAWGIDTRPTVQLSDDIDDFAFLADDELGDAPVNPGTGEGGDFKPTSKEEIGNKWCVRQCERCSMSNPGESHLPLKLKNFNKRRYNYHSKNEEN